MAESQVLTDPTLIDPDPDGTLVDAAPRFLPRATAARAEIASSRLPEPSRLQLPFDLLELRGEDL
jgi:hypothetical protein